MHVEPANANADRYNLHRRRAPHLTISCDECSMQATQVCEGCVVTFVLDRADGRLELDDDEAHVLELFGAAGMVPLLQFRNAAS
jgi:hypothetical protein